MMTHAVVAGAIGMASLVIALFFLRFWRSTGDRLFLYFSLSFILQAISRMFVETVALPLDDAPITYLLRVAAYGLILFAVIAKNRRPGNGNKLFKGKRKS
jgi:hypothetical protein